MILARKSRKFQYDITVYRTNGQELKFNYVDYCKLDSIFNILIIVGSEDADYIDYTDVKKVHIYCRNK